LLLSMTGHGQAAVQNDQVRVVAEIRTVNNRFLKTNINCDLDAAHQAKLETIVKQHVNRGSVNLRLKTHFLGGGEEFKLNEPLLRSYWLQLSEIAGSGNPVKIESLLVLPGVIAENVSEDLNEIVWPAAEQATTEALEKLNAMRSIEGDVMQRDMQDNCLVIADQLQSIKKLAPSVMQNYSKRMLERINGLLESFDVTIQASDIVKEVGVFAEKCDISEETVRLGSNIEQFNQVINASQSDGKKLDFLIQEMLRETNTIGSKANNVEVANHVVEIKTAIERIREMVQNVE
jgi:uncharacterized protein (TIGR00255 family)